MSAFVFVGIARLTLHIPGARSLKDRRRVVQQLKDRMRARLGISVCEVGSVEIHQQARLGIAVVGRSRSECRRFLEQARQMAEGQRDAILADTLGEVLSFGNEGGTLGGGIETLLDQGPFADTEED